MVAIERVRSINSSLTTSDIYTAAAPFTAAVIGGTAGIGEKTVLAIATNFASTGEKLRLYVVGRNESAGLKIVDEAKKLSPKATVEFIQAKNLALLKEVAKTANDIISATGKDGGQEKLDLLVMTTGYMTLKSWNETEEGLDQLLALIYYSRALFITLLAPLLTLSPRGGRVCSVWSPGWEKPGRYFPNDMALHKNHGVMNNTSQLCYMTTFFHELLAEKYAGKLALSHVFPGHVTTNVVQNGEFPWLVKALFSVAGKVSRAKKVEGLEVGDRDLFLTSGKYPPRGFGGDGLEEGLEVAIATDGTAGGGAYIVNEDSTILPLKDGYDGARKAGMKEKTWEHTNEVFRVVVDEGKVYKP